MRGIVVGVATIVAACGGGGKAHDDAPRPIDASPTLDASRDAFEPCLGYPATCVPTAAPTAPAAGSAACNPLTQAGCQAGEKCTWIHDAPGVGHIGCAPSGAVQVACDCTFGADGATGYDDCMQGLVCNRGVCRTICDPQRGNPMCDATHVCAAYAGLFTSLGSPNVAGVCDPQCDPLFDNDIAGSGRRGCACGSGTGCYGYPSMGTAPPTAFSCVLLGGANLIHRSPVSGDVYVNSCAQGYIPLLQDMTGSTQLVCIAMCKPLNCYAGNCGSNDANRFGAAPHRCMNPDAQGTFNGSADGDECQYLWAHEIDVSSGALLRSPYSDTLGFCFDHSKYRYDSNGDGQVTSADLTLPACQDLQLVGSGSNAADPTTYFGAKDLGCVDSTTAGVPRRPPDVLADLRVGRMR